MRGSIRSFSTCLTLVAALTLVAHAVPIAAQQPAAPAIEASAIPGSWSFVVDSPHGKMTFAMELRLESGKVLGTMSNDQMGTVTLTGAFADQTLKFTAESPGGTFTFTGKFKDRDTISGFLSGHAGDLVGIATRVKK
jgi:invasion protein IalB